MINSLKRTRIIKDSIEFVVRDLPGKPKILVQAGQQISPQDILAKTTINSGFRSINIATLLEVNPKDIKKYIKIEVAQKIFKGELLAFKPKSLFGFNKLVTSPTDGVLESINESTGEIRLSFLPRSENIPAAFYGFIEKVDPLRSKVWIKTCVTKVFGLCGSGRRREGVLKIIGKRSDLITKPKISSVLANHIIVGGALIYQQAIEASVGFGVSGIITGGINAKDFKAVAGGLTTVRKFGTDIGISILVTEGFGSLSIGEDIYSVFQKYDGRFAVVDGNRNEILIPSEDKDCILKVKSIHLPKEKLDAPEGINGLAVEALETGKTVRVVGPNFLGAEGKVLSIDKIKSKLPSGFVTYMATIETNTRKIKLPLLNLEIID